MYLHLVTLTTTYHSQMISPMMTPRFLREIMLRLHLLHLLQVPALAAEDAPEP
jgi:hypothetical protein